MIFKNNQAVKHALVNAIFLVIIIDFKVKLNDIM